MIVWRLTVVVDRGPYAGVAECRFYVQRTAKKALDAARVVSDQCECVEESKPAATTQ
jgi:hypothetical protein